MISVVVVSMFHFGLGTPTQELNKKKGTEKKIGFDRGLEPEKIIGATDSSGPCLLSFVGS